MSAAAFLAAIPIALWVFDGGPAGFVASGDSTQWEWGVPTTGPAGTEATWATRKDATYLNDSTDFLEVPMPDLSSATRPVMTFRHWFSIQPGDLGTVEVDDGSGWRTVTPIFGYPDPAGFTGASGDWVQTSVDLTGTGTSPRVRFAFTADAAVSDDGWYLSEVAVYDGDVTAPSILPVAIPTDTEVLDAAYPVQLQVLDDTAVLAVDLTYQVDGGTAVGVPFADLGGGLYQAQIPEQRAGSVVTWSALASDGLQEARHPATGDETFRVFLAAPTDLRLVDPGRLVGDVATLEWDPPVSIHTPISYRVEALDSLAEGPWVVFGTTADVPLLPDGARTFAVRGVYVGGIGDASDSLEIDAEVPELRLVWPPAAWPGDRIHLTVFGDALYLSQESVALELGTGVTVEEIEVVDVSTARCLVAIDGGASPGARDLTVTGTYGRFSFDEAFQVLDGDDAPRILSVEPARVTQGDEVELRIEASQPFFGDVAADLGEFLVLRSDPVVEDAVVRLSVIVDGRASPGSHTLVLDDGSRLWTVDLEVVERVYEGSTGCGGCTSTPLGPRFAPWGILLLMVRRRR